MLNLKDHGKSETIDRGQPAIAIKPGPVDVDEQLRSEVIDKMEAAGLIEYPSWPRPPVISADERARLARILGSGSPPFRNYHRRTPRRRVKVVFAGRYDADLRF